MPVKKFVKKMIFSHKLKFREGKIKLFGIKAALLPISTISKFIEEMYRHLGEEASKILFEIGKAQGKKAIDDIAKENKAGKREFLQKMADLANVMGIGRWKLEEFDVNREIKYSVEDSPLALELQDKESLANRDKPVEHFSRGIVYGIGMKVIEGDVTSEIISSQFLRDDRTVIRAYKEK